MLLPVVMAGGSGTRLWPLSRTLYPKQFLSLTSRLTMLQETLRRLEGLNIVLLWLFVMKFIVLSLQNRCVMNI